MREQDKSKLYIFLKHMIILLFLRLPQYHARTVEHHFPFLHSYNIYNAFKTIYLAPSKINH